jgi:hypothetical protein
MVFVIFGALRASSQITNLGIKSVHYNAYFEDEYISGPYLSELAADKLFICAARCLRHPKCKSFNYVEDERICQLSSIQFEPWAAGNVTLKKTNSKITFYYISDGKYI